MPLRQISGLRCSALRYRQLYTIHGGAAALPCFDAGKGMDRVQAQGLADGDGMAHTAAGVYPGATTTILPRSFTASTRFRMPGAVTPSSLVIRITGWHIHDLPALAFLLLVAFAMLQSYDILVDS